MEKVILEFAALIERKGLSLDAAAAEVGVPAAELYAWLLGESEPSAFFLGVLPGAVEDISRLYLDKE